MRSAITARCGRALRRISTRPSRRWPTLERSGISIDAVTAKLVEEGVQLFADAFDKLLGAVARKRAAMLGEKLDGQSHQAPAELEKLVGDSLESWRHDGNVRRLWAGDATPVDRL